MIIEGYQRHSLQLMTNDQAPMTKSEGSWHTARNLLVIATWSLVIVYQLAELCVLANVGYHLGCRFQSFFSCFRG